MMAQTATTTAMSITHNNRDKELITACIEGERSAQKTLYHRYSGAMFTLAFRITNERDSANDALQDAFIEIFRDLKSFREKSTLGAWMKTIVIRNAYRRLRVEDRYTEITDGMEEVNVHYDQFTSQALEREILALPDRSRAVFTLFEIEGYKHVEIAKLLDISASTSRTQLLYAKKILQKKLQNEIK